MKALHGALGLARKIPFCLANLRTFVLTRPFAAADPSSKSLPLRRRRRRPSLFRPPPSLHPKNTHASEFVSGREERPRNSTTGQPPRDKYLWPTMQEQTTMVMPSLRDLQKRCSTGFSACSRHIRVLLRSCRPHYACFLCAAINEGTLTHLVLSRKDTPLFASKHTYGAKVGGEQKYNSEIFEASARVAHYIILVRDTSPLVATRSRASSRKMRFLSEPLPRSGAERTISAGM